MFPQIVAVSSRIPTEPYYHFDIFMESLRRFGEVPTILGMSEPWRGLITKPNLLRDWLRAGKHSSDRLIVCDAWDVVFAHHPHGINDRCVSLFGDAVVFNAERACWPRAEFADRFPDPGSPWRYLNTGFYCGPADKILAILEWMNLDALGFDRRNADDTGWIYPDDQEQMQLAYFAGVEKMVIDTQCELGQTLSACEMGDFDLRSIHVSNRVTGSTPGVFHFNGDSKDKLLPNFLPKWGL